MHRESNWRLYFTIGVTLVCLFLIYPTIRYIFFEMTTEPPRKTEAMSPEEFQKREEAYDKKKQGLQRNSIKLGLDLIGGVDVQLKIDEAKALVHELETRADDVARRLQAQMIGATVVLNQDGSRLIVDLADKANARQASNILKGFVDNNIFSPFDTDAFQRTGKVELAMAEGWLRGRIQNAIESAERTIRERVDKFGVTQPSVSRQGMDSIRVQVPGEKDPQYVIEQIIKPAQLEFYALHKDNDTLVQTHFERVKTQDERGKAREEYRLKAGMSLPTGYRFLPGEKVIVSDSGIRTEEPEVYVVKKEPEMHGGSLLDAFVNTDPSDILHPIQVSLVFDKEGAVKFRELSKKYLKERVAIALDGIIYSAPVFESVIPDGQARITGNFSAAEAHDLSLVLKAGAMPAELQPVQQRAIGPTLGLQSIRDSMRALMIAAVCIGVFMIFYYHMAGFISLIALLLNILLVLACLALFDATLTLSGIGGIILTIGMAVDANVLIYERIREELRGGREIRAALRAGFSRAFSVIFDSNLTTLLTALVLLQFGEGTVQGFALTSAFGLIANLFTGLTVTYALCSLWVRLRGKLGVGSVSLFKDTKFYFIKVRRFSFSFSALLFLVCVFAVAIWPRPQLAVDMQGGVLSDIRIVGLPPENDQTQAIKRALEQSGLAGEQSRVQKVRTGTENDYVVRVVLQPDPSSTSKEGNVTYTQAQLEKALTAKYGQAGVQFLGTQSVSREIGQGFQQIALLLLIGASIAILVYLWFRFELVFGAAAVVALLHDFLITLGLLILMKYQISLDIVSGLMILIGFSVNDTIVIFDRVRENSHTMYGKPFRTICNEAMNQSLNRTIITVSTVLAVMVIMFFFGGTSLKPFAMTMIIGSFVGSYSTNFLATPLVFWWNERKKGQLKESLGRKKAGSQALEGQPLAAATAASGGISLPSSGAGNQRRGRR